MELIQVIDKHFGVISINTKRKVKKTRRKSQKRKKMDQLSLTPAKMVRIPKQTQLARKDLKNTDRSSYNLIFQLLNLNVQKLLTHFWPKQVSI
jgi:hypothetical protein